MKKILIITGPTGVGKTDISLEVAKKLNGEIISCDSMQIYKGMDIGTAKIKSEEMKNISHNMIDIVEPTEEFSVAEFKKMSDKIIERLISENKTPILVGGTGLYLNSFIFDRNHNEIKKDEKFRNKMNEYDNDTLFHILISKDPDAEKLFHKNERKRIIRSLEIIEYGGQKPSILRKNLYNPSSEYDSLIFFIKRERESLYSIIDKRVDKMIDEGLEEEVKSFYDKGYTIEMQSMLGIGYREFLQYFMGEISRDEAINLIKQHSRNYAKRQFTFFRKIEGINVISADEMSKEAIADLIIKRWRNNEKGNL